MTSTDITSAKKVVFIIITWTAYGYCKSDQQRLSQNLTLESKIR